MKMMLPCKREHHFEGPGASKSEQTSIKKQYQKQIRKITVLYRFGDHFGYIMDSKNELKNDTENDAKSTDKINPPGPRLGRDNGGIAVPPSPDPSQGEG